MHILYLALLALTVSAATEEKKPKKDDPCTIHSPSDNFFNLQRLKKVLPAKDSKSSKQGEPVKSWPSRGYDYGANFTINICGGVVEELHDVEDIEKSRYQNISAFYVKDRTTYSMGSENSELVFRGRKMVLNYTGGSYCATGKSKRSLATDLSRRRDDPVNHGEGGGRKPVTDKDDKKDVSKDPPKQGARRKSTTISFLCDQDPVDPKNEPLHISFVGTDDDECAYFFEARSPYACPGYGVETTPQQLGPGGVFGVIMLIALLVYLIGGCAYQRTVMHQRGWKQLPNYSFWSNTFGFLTDMFIILTSSCARFLPGRRGYRRVSMNGGSRSRGIHSHDDENRLIDQLDDDWED